MSPLATAWVPDDDPERDWRVAAGLAAGWVEDRCREEGTSGVLVTNSLDHLGVPELDDFERRHVRTSRLARRGRVGSGMGPVLSYVPHAKDLEFAMSLARRSSLGVVETVSFPLTGWAARLGAINLVTGETTSPLSDPVNDAVDRLKFYGNNGFGDDFGKRQAQSILADLRAAGSLDGGLILGAVLATGVSARGVGNLSRLIDKLSE
jgi:hypothetical protein